MKLTRNIFIIPAVFVLAIASARSVAATSALRPATRSYASALPGFVFGFLALVIARSFIDAFALVPTDSWNVVRTLGSAPLLVGFLAATFLAAVSYGIVRTLGVGR